MRQEIQISKHANNQILVEDDKQSIVVGNKKAIEKIKQLGIALAIGKKSVNLSFQGTSLNSGRKVGVKTTIFGQDNIHIWMAILEHYLDYEGRTMH